LPTPMIATFILPKIKASFSVLADYTCHQFPGKEPLTDKL
jgi:hypothetical protein